MCCSPKKAFPWKDQVLFFVFFSRLKKIVEQLYCPWLQDTHGFYSIILPLQPKVIPNAICGICQKGKEANKKGKPEALIHCSQCDNSGKFTLLIKREFPLFRFHFCPLLMPTVFTIYCTVFTIFPHRIKNVIFKQLSNCHPLNINRACINR